MKIRDFYRKLLQRDVIAQNKTRFAVFQRDGLCLSIMNGSFDREHSDEVVHREVYSPLYDDTERIMNSANCGKVVINLCTDDLEKEYRRIRELGTPLKSRAIMKKGRKTKVEYKLIGLAKAELAALEQEVPEGKHIQTGDIRRLSAKLFRQVPDRKIGVVLELCNAFLEEHSWAMGVIAFDWASRMKQEYSENTYDIFYGWLKKYVRGWGDCDDFCTHAFGELLRQNKSLFPRIVEWTEDPDFWMRRAAAVILIPAILRKDYEGLEPLIIADRLLQDENDLVLKGYGWMLKALSQVDQPAVKSYLIKNHEKMPRVAYRYALEKFDKDTRAALMQWTDFATITACGECCTHCSKKAEGLCPGCIEADGYVPEWAGSGRCKVYACARKHGVQFCGICAEFPCRDLTAVIHWNPHIVEHLNGLAEKYHKQNAGEACVMQGE